MEEIWRDIKDFEGYYQISNLGNVKSLNRTVPHNYSKNIKVKERILKPCIIPTTGYRLVNLLKNNKYKKYTIHRLVCIAFIPNPENKEFVNHINGIKTDNRVDNLEWCTRSENMIHAVNNNLIKNRSPKKGLDHHNVKSVFMVDICTKITTSFISISEASKSMSISRNSIISNCKGRIKSVKNKIFYYAT